MCMQEYKVCLYSTLLCMKQFIVLQLAVQTLQSWKLYSHQPLSLYTWDRIEEGEILGVRGDESGEEEEG